MISIDQVLLLEQKVESAVKKIKQLQAENDALNQQIVELKNALSSKSEQLSSYENDQNKIESGIRKALERLNTIENTVLNVTAGSPLNNPVAGVKSPVTANPSTSTVTPVAVPVQKNPVEKQPVSNEIPQTLSFDDMSPIAEQESDEDLSSVMIDPSEDINDSETAEIDFTEDNYPAEEYSEAFDNNEIFADESSSEDIIPEDSDDTMTVSSIDDAFSQTNTFESAEDIINEDFGTPDYDSSEPDMDSSDNPDEVDFDIF